MARTTLKRIEAYEKKRQEVEYGLKEFIQGALVGFIIGFIIAIKLL